VILNVQTKPESPALHRVTRIRLGASAQMIAKRLTAIPSSMQDKDKTARLILLLALIQRQYLTLYQSGIAIPLPRSQAATELSEGH